VCGLSLQPIGRTPTLSVMQSAAAAAVRGLWRYISAGPLPHIAQSDVTYLEQPRGDEQQRWDKRWRRRRRQVVLRHTLVAPDLTQTTAQFKSSVLE